MGSGVMKQVREVKIVQVNSNAENMNKTLSQSLETSLKTPVKTKCYKIKLACDETPICYNINLAGTSLYRDSFEYAIYFNYIKEMHNSYASARGYFATRVHEICFTDSKISNGFKVLMISLHSNPIKNFTFFTSHPFITVENVTNLETQEILNSFLSLSQEIERVLQKNSKKIKKCNRKMENFRKDLQNYSAPKKFQGLIKKNLKLCSYAFHVSENLLNEASQTHESFKNLFEGLEKDLEKYQDLGMKALELGFHSGEEIVHGLLIK
jgi:hypothetical protein